MSHIPHIRKNDSVLYCENIIDNTAYYSFSLYISLKEPFKLKLGEFQVSIQLGLIYVPLPHLL